MKFVQDGTPARGFEGFIVDLLDALSEKTGIDFA